MADKQEAGQQARERLIEAALLTLQARGAAALTLDAVAREAGLSKGGLLHHFPNKDALIEALLRHLFKQFEQRVQYYYSLEQPRPGRWLRAYIHASFEEHPIPLEISLALLSAIIENSALMAIIQEDFKRWQDILISDGIAPARATIIRQAADASWMERLLDLEPPDPVLRAHIMAQLLHMAESV
ncbi:MAG: TetR/AcrR family transcriptional regulator [Anaerolineae bacterium]